MSTRLAVRVHPGAAVEGLTGRLADGTLRLGVRASPEGGRANRAATDLLAALLGVARSRVSVVRGPGSRTKVIEVEGMSEAEVNRRLDKALEARGRTDGQ